MVYNVAVSVLKEEHIKVATHNTAASFCVSPCTCSHVNVCVHIYVRGTRKWASISAD